MIRRLFTLAVLLGGAGLSYGQTHNLSETPKVGECLRIDIDTMLLGHLKVYRDGGFEPIKLVAGSRHIYVEKTLAVKDGLPSRTARLHEVARSTIELPNEKLVRTLSADRKLAVTQRTAKGIMAYSPAGSMKRDDLELLEEHFDSTSLTGLLPGKEVAVGDTWEPSNEVVQALCLFDGLVSRSLTARFAEVKDGSALITLTGKASGIENAALVHLTIDAVVRFDLLRKRITGVDWKQKDSRDQGPISPGLEVETTTMLRRFPIEEPSELGPIALAGVVGDPTPAQLNVHMQEPNGKYTLNHARDWHLVSQSEQHTVLRFMEGGNFLAQVTLTLWKPLEPGKRITVEEFKKIIAESPGWELQEIVEEAVVTEEKDRWIYRVGTRGELDGLKVAQTFFVINDSSGRLVIAVFTMKPENVAKIGTKDIALVQGIELPRE